jgi:hypothetical protein
LVRRKWPVIAALTLILSVSAGWIAWDQTHTAGVRNGEAFGPDGAVGTIGMTTARKGDEVWYVSPMPANMSDAELTLEKVSPAAVSPGLDYLDARIYKRSDFISGVPLSWGTADGASSNPGQVPSRPIQGYKLQAGQQMDDVIFLHFRVTTAQRPLETSGVTVEYKQRHKTFKQVLQAVFRLENPKSAGN